MTAALQIRSAEARALGYRQVNIDADPHAEDFYIACGATSTGKFVAAPVANDANRVRPQLRMALR